MRTENEVMNLIIDFGKEKDNIKAIYMNGSRVNKNIEKDIMQDYDIVYVCNNIDEFIDNKQWIDYFGEVCIMQEPDNSEIFVVQNEGRDSYAFLIQFKDGVRIDFTFMKASYALKVIYDDRLVKTILDKDNILPKLSEASDEDYVLKKPTLGQFKSCCNEFWWVSTYVAKGLYRGELLYAIDHLNYFVREMLLLMLAYKAGYKVDYQVSFGKNYKLLPKYLSNDDYLRLKETYCSLEKEKIWNSLYKSMDLFKEISIEVAGFLEYAIDMNEINNTYIHINRIYNDEFKEEVK